MRSLREIDTIHEFVFFIYGKYDHWQRYRAEAEFKCAVKITVAAFWLPGHRIGALLDHIEDSAGWSLINSVGEYVLIRRGHQ